VTLALDLSYISREIKEKVSPLLASRKSAFNEAMLRGSLDELRRLTQEKTEIGLDRAQAICSQAGVAVVLVPELPSRGSAGVPNG
jgi:hypothetical protein